MKFLDVVDIVNADDDSDFYIIASGRDVGCPSRVKVKNSLGVKVKLTDIVDPNFLYYYMEYMHNQGIYAGANKITKASFSKFQFMATK